MTGLYGRVVGVFETYIFDNNKIRFYPEVSVKARTVVCTGVYSLKYYRVKFYDVIRSFLKMFRRSDRLIGCVKSI